MWSTPRSSGSNWRAGSICAEVTPAFMIPNTQCRGCAQHRDRTADTEKPAPITAAVRRDQGIALDRRGADAFCEQHQAESYTDRDLHSQSFKSDAERGIDVQRYLVASKTRREHWLVRRRRRCNLESTHLPRALPLIGVCFQLRVGDPDQGLTSDQE